MAPGDTGRADARTESWRRGRYELRRDQRRLLVDGLAVRLGGRAFDLFVALADRRGRVASKDELLQALWPGAVVEENTLQVHISALRKVLGADAIHTVPGRGYLLALAADGQGQADAAATGVQSLPEPELGNEPLHTLPNELPHDLPPLIGREPDRVALQRLMATHRVVTVVGPGGVGKTRLALAAASPPSPLGMAAMPTRLIELAGVAEGAPVAEAAARALGIDLPGLQAAQVELVDVLKPREVLLLLDNCEHRLEEVATLVAALARDTPRVRVLATSQQPLGCRSEQVFRLGPLAVPGEAASAADAVAAGSLALLIERVAWRDPGFAVDEHNLADAVAICRRLDGLPLAIELAAARVPMLGLSGLRERLTEHLRLLGSSPGRETHQRPERHRTLRAAIAWSHAMLDADERRVFRRLGVFAGSFSITLAEAVVAEPGPAASEVLDHLQALIDKSLVLRVEGTPGGAEGRSSARLRLLDSTHAFALEQLNAAGEYTLAMQRLCAALLPVFELSAAQRAQHTGGAIARSRAAEIDNLRAALDWLGAQPTLAAQQVELAGASAWIWPRAGLRLEGLRRCRDALGRLDADTPVALEAQLQLGYARQVHRRALPEDCAAADRAATLYAQLDDRLARFQAWSILAHMRALRGDEAATMAALEAMAEAFDPAGSVIQWGTYLFTTGHALAQLGRMVEAMQINDQAAQLARSHPTNLPGHALLGMAKAQMYALYGRFDDALAAARDGLEAARQQGASGRTGMLLGDIATYLTELGRLDEAVLHAREAIEVRSRDGTLWLQLDQLAQLACARGRPREAALALGRAEVHNRWRPGRRERALQRPFERATAAVQAAFPADELRMIYAQGGAMGDDEVARVSLGPA